MTPHRFLFYDADAGAHTSTVTLSGDEHRHLSRSLRRTPGDAIYVTNGRGLIVECRVAGVGRGSTTAEVVRVVENKPPTHERVLALGLIRKERFERAFEQCVELGITRCVPFRSKNSGTRSFSSQFRIRLRKIAIAAIKQSFRSYLPDVSEPVPFDELVSAVHQTGRTVVGAWKAPPPRPFGAQSTLVVVGPEAGLTEAEVTALTGAGAERAGVSSHRLRSETAAVALVGAMWRDD